MTTVTYHLGVDLGTTYTAAARARAGRAEPVTLGTRSLAVPSVVYLAGDDLLVGDTAVRRAASAPARVAREFKRRVGDPTPLLLGGAPVAAERLMARVLDWVVRQVAATEGEPPASLAVTHPANWGEFKLDLLRQAVRHVDLTVDHLVPEPVAAASFYAAQRPLAPGSLVAVYDLGGGTFDAAMVRVDGDGFRIVGRPDGIERLGGIDFDHAVFNHVLEVLGIQADELDPADPSVTAALVQLRHDCVEAKEALSSDTDVSIPVLLPQRHTEVRLTRAELEAMIRPAIGETLTALRRAILSATANLDEVSAVLLVGGSSRIPLIAHLLTAELGRPVAVDARPKEAISLGAALLADQAAIGAGAGLGAGGPAGAAAAGAQAGPPAPPPTRATAGASTDARAPTSPADVSGPPLEPGPTPPTGVSGSVPGAVGSSPRRLWLVAAMAALVASLAASTQIDTLRAEDAAAGKDDPGQDETSTSSTSSSSSTSTTTGTDSTTTTTSTGGDALGGLIDVLGGMEAGSDEAFDPLPGSGWSTEARADFVRQCVDSSLATYLGAAGLGPEEGCGCIYDEAQASGQATLAEFNEALVATDIDPDHPGANAMEHASVSCALG